MRKLALRLRPMASPRWRRLERPRCALCFSLIRIATQEPRFSREDFSFGPSDPRNRAGRRIGDATEKGARSLEAPF